jgi:hypothetical protein
MTITDHRTRRLALIVLPYVRGQHRIMMGGALGPAVLASLAASRSQSLRGTGHAANAALDGGYHLAFVLGAAFAAAAFVGATLLRGPATESTPDAVLATELAPQ